MPVDRMDGDIPPKPAPASSSAAAKKAIEELTGNLEEAIRREQDLSKALDLRGKAQGDLMAALAEAKKQKEAVQEHLERSEKTRAGLEADLRCPLQP